MHSDELLVPDENDDPSEMSEFGRLADFISGRVPEKEFRNFGAVNRRKKNCHHMGAQWWHKFRLPFSNCENVIDRSLI